MSGPHSTSPPSFATSNPITTSAPLPQPSSALPASSSPTSTTVELSDHAVAIYGLQRQMGMIATQVSDIENRSSSSGSSSDVSPSQPPPSMPYGLPSYGGIPALPATTSTIVHTLAFTTPPPSAPIPITHIQFPPSPSPIPALGAQAHRWDSTSDSNAVPHFHKLSFPTFDGKDNPLGWLSRCDHFFHAQHTPETDKVWLASFHLTGVTQHWYFGLERDAGGLHAMD